MTLGLSPEQQELCDAVGQFAARNAPIATTRDTFDELATGGLPAWWDALVANGFHAVHLPEELGGQGGRLIDAACVLESAGKSLLPGPLLPTVAAGAVALLADPTPSAQSLVRDLAAGITAAVVLPGDGDLRARAENGRWIVSGASGVTPGVCAARIILVGAQTQDGDVAWVPVDTQKPAVTAEPVSGTDLVADAGILRLDDYAATDSEALTGIDPERARCVLVGLVASTTAGIVQWCLQAVTAHLRSREQFGKVIGTFQALQHSAAMLLVNSELATAAAWDAVRAVDESVDQHRMAAAGAAVIAISPAPDLVLDALTMLGAIGFTWEHDVHLYWRRAISLAGSIGPANRWARRLGELTCTQTRDMSVNLGDAEPEFRSWVAETLDAALQLRNDKPAPHGDYEHLATGAQRTLIAEAGLMAPHWPAPWGVDADPLKQLIIDEEFAKRPALVRPSLNIAEWILPSVLAAAPKDLQEQLIPATQRGDILWCQLFSEPGAGSDLASLATRATKVDGGWRINGHKIWTSLAQYADLGALLARTDPEASKHRGIGYFILDMRSPGVEIQPIKTATGQAHFNEVFLNDVFVPDEMLLGGPTDGWSLAIATMAEERSAISGYVKFDRAVALRRLAAQPGPDRDDALRALGELDAYTNAIRALGVRETIRLLDGQASGPASSIAKVAMNVLLRRTFQATLQLTGQVAMVDDPDAAVVEPYLHLPAELIGGGTREIQLNIIAQMILGLPRK
ncbi:acyl-CoA dehydrogenase [Mycobacterium marseillense]|jgi:alkylation response protein AidB-like acyl-CoA dehydrogenase|uniref:Acyl-CoA dehydrogenase n=1 Tax=Mycobacterium marseillense TaxID=701042 RepID=A0ABN5ZWM0_9MYCO|nr:acyl-CoA dehydrogenase [Mycobacterium marseillense]MCA2262826.1 acyl-CoA dehydrogenase [Mycobacterium marseillense]MCV7404645.1 acyl-CoA dehydrogenase [Mycobacterium marseillense]MDM3975521.1 acyl-CoA dehydrogenase [Mycobacterium marseillense]OBJ66136.1 acyl-CoA dehydrogenase [Mycobacterium marseillense]ORA95584.1 acyl-CoA dehydrogenase [Mycobacterium marseillense]